MLFQNNCYFKTIVIVLRMGGSGKKKRDTITTRICGLTRQSAPLHIGQPNQRERDVAYFAKRTYIILDRESEDTFEMHNVEREMLRTLQRELTSLIVGNQENA